MEHKNDTKTQFFLLSHNASTHNELPLTTDAIFFIAESFLPFLHFNVQGKYHSPENIFEACAISAHSLKDFLFYIISVRKSKRTKYIFFFPSTNYFSMFLLLCLNE